MPKTASKGLILKTVSEFNILPLTSECNGRCIFCSHKGNPPGVEVFVLPKLSPEEIIELAEFLSPDRKIIIGESATRIIEGEPFIYPDLIRVLEYIRKRFPGTPIQITTSGFSLDKGTVMKLADLKPIGINLSLNSSDILTRHRLMPGLKEDRVIEGIEYMCLHDIPFEGSLVAVEAEDGGYIDAVETIKFLAAVGSRAIKVYIPGYTRLFPGGNGFFTVYNKILDALCVIKNSVDVPILLEPAVIEDLSPVVEGVIRGSPAWHAEIFKGDIIEYINGIRPLTRLDAFNKIKSAGSVNIKVRRGREVIDRYIKKERGEAPGIVFPLDIDPIIGEYIKKAVERNRARRPLIMTSILGEGIIKTLLKRYISKRFHGDNLTIKPVENRFFGGTISCGGLLVVDDFIHALKDVDFTPDLIVIPSVPFDHRGRDLLGKFFLEIEGYTGIKVEII